MSTRLSLFTATLVQDTALSVSGLDRESTADLPFAIVDGVPTLVGRGIKGAAVAMARRFFAPLPRCISDQSNRATASRRSAWEVADATPLGSVDPRVRAGVGILQKTGARAEGVLYDREVIPAGTRWALTFRVDWTHAASVDEATEAEGILGYVLARHWALHRCWLGGGVARGLGWCHVEELRAYRLDTESYDRWVESGRIETSLPTPLKELPLALPTQGWCFRTLDVELTCGEYRPDNGEAAWGLDMMGAGPADAERTVQQTGDGTWAKPTWAERAPTPEELSTDRAILMEGRRPVLPGSSLRGPLRHALSRLERARGRTVEDPHPVKGAVAVDDPAGVIFGSVATSSRVLVRDSIAESGWAAAKLHMHAEDEFSAGAYGTSKRDAVRMLRGTFPARIVVEGKTPEEVEPLVATIDRLAKLGELGHLPVGGHKTRGAGSGRWVARSWVVDDVEKARSWTPPEERASSTHGKIRPAFPDRPTSETKWVKISHGALDLPALTLGDAARRAQAALGAGLSAWWCDPTNDLRRAAPVATFGGQWPIDEDVCVDEVAFFADRAVWRAAKTGSGARWTMLEEVESGGDGARCAEIVHTPTKLHGFERFSAANTGEGTLLLREWHADDGLLGFTLAMEASS